jgi:hypothetical protein
MLDVLLQNAAFVNPWCFLVIAIVVGFGIMEVL